jgi:hypothetical protein
MLPVIALILFGALGFWFSVQQAWNPEPGS